MMDFVNGLFELSAALILWMNFRRLQRDRILKGICWEPVALFAAWGVWNLAYYSSLAQWWSFSAGIGVVVANAAWLLLLYKIRRENRG